MSCIRIRQSGGTLRNKHFLSEVLGEALVFYLPRGRARRGDTFLCERCVCVCVCVWRWDSPPIMLRSLSCIRLTEQDGERTGADLNTSCSWSRLQCSSRRLSRLSWLLEYDYVKEWADTMTSVEKQSLCRALMCSSLRELLLPSGPAVVFREWALSAAAWCDLSLTMFESFLFCSRGRAS